MQASRDAGSQIWNVRLVAFTMERLFKGRAVFPSTHHSICVIAVADHGFSLKNPEGVVDDQGGIFEFGGVGDFGVKPSVVLKQNPVAAVTATPHQPVHNCPLSSRVAPKN